MTIYPESHPSWRTFLSPDPERSRPRVGLSTDLYFPPLPDLLNTLSEGPLPEYLEIFRARTADLERARLEVPPHIPLTYHGDGLWYTQADFPDNPAYREELDRAKRHMEVLDSPWMIHECAQKMMEGFAFGLYAPPLLTDEGALAARRGALTIKEALGQRLLLVETPPFPPHPPGPMDLGTYFRRITENSPLGVGLDIGHCLTYLAVTGRPVSPEALIAWLKGDFPLERVIEIHVGGLAKRTIDKNLTWIDDHAVAILDILFESLEAVLEGLSLPALRGVALEVDNKILPLIAREFARFYRIVEGKGRPCRPLPVFKSRIDLPSLNLEDERRLRDGYANLAREMAEREISPYRVHLYPEEVWSFGGSMPDLFPETLALLFKWGVDVRRDFISFFNRNPRSIVLPMDFLEVKVHRTLEWIDALSEGQDHGFSLIRETAEREASIILSAQKQFNGDPL